MSARLDGETTTVAPAVVDRHLAGCQSCRAWAAAADGLHRRTRLAVAPFATDLTARVLASVANDRAGSGRPARSTMPVRAALVLLAVVQLLLSGPVLLLGHDHSAPIHIAHEVGSFDAALAIGLLLAALRPRLASGMLPLVAAITGLLLVTAGSDIAVGRTDLADEAPHLLDLLGFLLLVRLGTGHRGHGPLRSARTVPATAPRV